MEQVGGRLRIALICYVSNPMVRSHLPLGNRVFYNLVRRLLGLPTKGDGYGDIASWTTATIEELVKSNIELCVISPHSGLKRPVVSFQDGGVDYHFIECNYGNMLARIIKNNSIWMALNPMGRRINRIVDRFNPDLVVLIGAENAFYSYSVLSITNYPVFVLCQTVYNNPERAQYSQINIKSADVERRIFLEKKYFAVFSRMHYSLLKDINPHAQVFKFGFPSKGLVLEPVCNPIKEYDFVNFALTMDLRKGFHDSLRALAIVKKTHPNVSLNFVGGCNSEMREELNKIITDLNLESNVVFTPFFDKQSDLFLHIQKSRFAVLPCKLDNTSGTMTQSMMLGLPLVVYRTAGTPSINRDSKCVLIAEKNNIDDLAGQMLYLLDHPNEAKQLAINARNRMIRVAEYSKGNLKRLLDSFNQVIGSYRSGQPVPEKYLFNPDYDD